MPPRVPCGYRQRPRYKFQNLIGLAIASRNGVGASTAVSALQIIRPILVNDGLYHFVKRCELSYVPSNIAMPWERRMGWYW